MPSIDVYFSTLSPYTYLACGQLSRIAARHGAAVTYKPLDIAALFDRTGGTRPADRHESRKSYRLEDLRRRAVRLGLPLNVQPAHWPTNGAPAAYAIIAAQKAGGGDMAALVHAILRATWTQQRDIAEDAVIAACLSETGFDPTIASTGLLSGAEDYARNLEDAVDAGVFGAPFFVVDGAARFWGQDRLEDMDLHLSGTL